MKNVASIWFFVFSILLFSRAYFHYSVFLAFTRKPVKLYIKKYRNRIRRDRHEYRKISHHVIEILYYSVLLIMIARTWSSTRNTILLKYNLTLTHEFRRELHSVVFYCYPFASTPQINILLLLPHYCNIHIENTQNDRSIQIRIRSTTVYIAPSSSWSYLDR
jgi:hypothetical protein